MLRKSFISLFLMCCVPAVHADAIGRLKSFIASTHSGQANFTQELLDKNGKQLQSASGTMQFVRPGRFRWVYQKPYEQLIVGDGKRFWLYDVDLNQVTEKKLDAALGSSPAALLSGNNEIERGFSLKDISCSAVNQGNCQGGPERDGLEWLEAIPRNHEVSIEKIRMAFDRNSDLMIMELFDSFGHHTLLHFSDFRRNPQLSSKLFKFVPPKDADILSDE